MRHSLAICILSNGWVPPGGASYLGEPAAEHHDLGLIAWAVLQSHAGGVPTSGATPEKLHFPMCHCPPLTSQQAKARLGLLGASMP